MPHGCVLRFARMFVTAMARGLCVLRGCVFAPRANGRSGERPYGVIPYCGFRALRVGSAQTGGSIFELAFRRVLPFFPFSDDFPPRIALFGELVHHGSTSPAALRRAG